MTLHQCLQNVHPMIISCSVVCKQSQIVQPLNCVLCYQSVRALCRGTCAQYSPTMPTNLPMTANHSRKGHPCPVCQPRPFPASHIACAIHPSMQQTDQMLASAASSLVACVLLQLLPLQRPPPSAAALAAPAEPPVPPPPQQQLPEPGCLTLMH